MTSKRGSRSSNFHERRISFGSFDEGNIKYRFCCGCPVAGGGQCFGLFAILVLCLKLSLMLAFLAEPESWDVVATAVEIALIFLGSITTLIALCTLRVKPAIFSLVLGACLLCLEVVVLILVCQSQGSLLPSYALPSVYVGTTSSGLSLNYPNTGPTSASAGVENATPHAIQQQHLVMLTFVTNALFITVARVIPFGLVCEFVIVTARTFYYVRTKRLCAISIENTSIIGRVSRDEVALANELSQLRQNSCP